MTAIKKYRTCAHCDKKYRSPKTAIKKYRTLDRLEMVHQDAIKKYRSLGTTPYHPPDHARLRYFVSHSPQTWSYIFLTFEDGHELVQQISLESIITLEKSQYISILRQHWTYFEGNNIITTTIGWYNTHQKLLSSGEDRLVSSDNIPIKQLFKNN